MKTEGLKKYLEIVIDLEKDVYIQQRTISTLRNFANDLGRKKEIEFPLEYKEQSMKGRATGGLVLVMDISYMILKINSGFTNMYLLILMIIAPIIAIAIGIVIDTRYEKKNKILMENHRKLVSEDNMRVIQEQEQQRYIYPKIRKLESNLSETKQLLQRFYNLNITKEEDRDIVTLYNMLYCIDNAHNNREDYSGLINIYNKGQQTNIEAVIRQINGEFSVDSLIDTTIREAKIQDFSNKKSEIELYISDCEKRNEEYANFIENLIRQINNGEAE